MSQDQPRPVHLCGACKRIGRCRLGLIDERLVGPGQSVTRLICPEDHEGGPGVAHGGWTAAAMDDMLGHLAILEDQMAVTGTLIVKFLKPVPVGLPLEGRAWRDRTEGHRRYHRVEIRLASSGALLAVAEGIFVERDREAHFRNHEAWLATQRDPSSDA